MIENCSAKMKDVLSISFHVASQSPSLSRLLCLTLTVRYKMWPVDLGTKKTHFSYASNFIWMTLLPGQGLALSPSLHFFLTLLHFSAPIFHSCYKNSPYSRSPGHPPHCSCAQNYHNSYIFLSSRFISGWTMQKIKAVIPKSHERAHCLKICYWELNPYRCVCAANEQGFLLKSRCNAWIWASELWKDAVGERGLEHAAERRTHALTHIDMSFIWNHFVDPEGDAGSRPGSERKRRRGTKGRWRTIQKSVTIVEVAFSLTNCLWVSTGGMG